MKDRTKIGFNSYSGFLCKNNSNILIICVIIPSNNFISKLSQFIATTSTHFSITYIIYIFWAFWKLKYWPIPLTNLNISCTYNLGFPSQIYQSNLLRPCNISFLSFSIPITFNPIILSTILKLIKIANAYSLSCISTYITSIMFSRKSRLLVLWSSISKSLRPP